MVSPPISAATQSGGGGGGRSATDVTRPLTVFETASLAAASGALAKTIVAPIERMKLMLRTSGVSPSPRTAGILQTFGYAIRETGLTSLWRGNLHNLLRYVPNPALNFSLLNASQQLLVPASGRVRDLPTSVQFGSGALAGVSSLVVLYPADTARNVLAHARYGAGQYGPDGKLLPVPKHMESGSVVRYLSHEWFNANGRGITHSYRLFGVSAVGVAVYRGFYFGLYEHFRYDPITQTNRNGEYQSKWWGLPQNIGLAYGATVMSGLGSYPVDTIRRRMQLAVQSMDRNPEYHKVSSAAAYATDAFGMAKHIQQKEGLNAFYRGAGANILRSWAGAMTLLFFEYSRAYYLERETYSKDNNKARPPPPPSADVAKRAATY